MVVASPSVYRLAAVAGSDPDGNRAALVPNFTYPWCLLGGRITRIRPNTNLEWSGTVTLASGKIAHYVTGNGTGPQGPGGPCGKRGLEGLEGPQGE